jgi:diguanylate cyclase (GGDEF)-like protein/PAS domain S-box-containing protein
MAGGMTTASNIHTASHPELSSAIIEGSLDAILTFGEDGNIATFNPAAERMFGYPAVEIVGQPIETLLQGERRTGARDHAKMDSLWDKLAADGKNHECMGRTREEEALHLEISVSRTTVADAAVFILVARDVSLRKREDAHTRFLAHFDSLTGLPNRTLFEERASQAITQTRRTGMVLALMMLDLDRFKEVNDSLGHQVGDRLLAAAAKRIRESVRETDTVTRLGGDEFAVLVTNLADATGAATVGEAIVAALNSPFDLDGERVITSASLGITTFPADGAGVDVLLRNADRALYRAKAKGRNTYQFYVPEMDAMIQSRKAMERDLRHALDVGELCLEYQPAVDAVTGEITSVEVLVRWNNPERGRLPAREFIPAVERTDLILRLGRWVMREACTQVKAWRDVGLPTPRLSINLSPAELHHRDLVSEIVKILDEIGIAASLLQLEFSEEAFLLAVQKNPQGLARLREMGVGISLDDFGSGVSSIEALKRHPVSRLKVDRSFLDRLDEADEGETLLGPLVELARGLGAQVTVESVETRDQMKEAQRRGATELQGYFLCRPVDPEVLSGLLRAGNLYLDDAVTGFIGRNTSGN